MNKKFIIRRAICALLAIVIVVACMPFSAFASNDSPTFSSDAANSLMKNTVPSGYDKTTNPYGYGVDKPFAMVEQSELMYLETYTNHTAGKMADVGTASSLQSFVSKNNTASNGSLTSMDVSALKNFVLVQSAAFDPNGSGRRDHVAYVGLNRSDKKVYAFVYDAVSGNLCSSEVVGEMNWAFDSDGDVTISGYNSNRFINVTAGDFNNDGKDTLIIYVANSKKTPSTKLHGLDYESEKYEVGCYLKEYDFADNKLNMLNRLENDEGYYKMGYDLLNDSYIAYYQSGTSSSSSSAYVRADVINGSTDDSSSNQYTKLTVDMVVGDFNGDRIDDLAVLSYFGGAGAYASEYNSTPQIKIRYGTTGTYTGSFVDSKGDEKYTIITLSDADSNEYRKLLSVCDGGLACGDINNDGYDDLFVAGTKLYTNYYKDNGDALLGSYLQDEDTFAYCVLINNCNKGFVQSEVKSMTANDWTYGCSPNAVEAVAFNGENAADFIFINGSLYTYDSSTGGFNTVSSQGYTTSGFQFDGALGGHEEFMRSVVVGNFDGNTAGREQIVFVASCRDKDSVYSFKKGMIAGVYSNDSGENYDVATGFKTTISDWGPSNANGGYNGTGAQVVLTSCDRDQDGVIARYKGVSYAYSDPEIKAVIQAAPYFAALGDSANNETDYTVTESYELEQSSSKNVSYSVGMSYSYGGLLSPFEVNVSSGYSLEWSKTYSEALETEYAMTVKAQAYNTALVARTPVFIYCYEVLDENGEWSDGTAMTLSIPQQPVYQQMSIDDYNSFADEYNNYMEEKGNRAITKESDKTSKTEACYYRLEKIDKAENWLDGNEGNPYMYNQQGWGAYSAIGAEQLSQNTIRLGYAGGLNEVSYSKSNIKSVSEDISHGFYFNFSISFGVAGDGILFSHDVGFETSLSYSNGSGVSTTKTSSQGCIGAVNDIDGPALAEEGIPASIYTQYAFDWTLGQWFRHLYGEEGNKTVFIGYSLSNINTPAPAVDDLEAELIADDAVRLNWSQPDKTPGWPDVEGYYVYRAEDGKYTKISDFIPAETLSYDIENLKTNTDYTFTVTSVCKVDGKEKESAWSNLADVTTAKRDYKVNYSVDNNNAADIKVRHLGNVEIKSGDEISESEVIKVKVAPKSGQYKLVSLTLDNGGETMVFTPEEDGTIDCAFILNGEANMSVTTKRAINSAQITFTDTYTANDAVIGTVSATVGDTSLNAPGGTVTDDVTFTAAPAKEYGLKSWKITDAEGNTETIDAANSNTYTLGLASEKYTVEAEFVSLSKIGKLVKVDIPSEGGTVEITDANGDTVALNENNSVYVPVNSKLTFTAKADAGCKFGCWTKDVEGQSGESFTVTITKDTEIGVEFDVPVRVGLTYSAASGEETGTVATKQGYQSGTGVPVGTKITLTAQAAENYRVQKIQVTSGGKTETVNTDDALFNRYNYEVIVDAETDIQFYFTKIEEYTVTFNSPKHADIVVKNGNDDFESGKTVRYGDELTFTVTPKENYRLADLTSWTDNGDGSYTYKTGAIKAETNISVKIEEIPEYTVTFPTKLDGCILSVKNGDEKINSGDKIREGTQLTATATLDSTYILKGWYIGGEMLSDVNNTEVTFTVNSDLIVSVIVADVKGDMGDKGDTGVGVKSVVINKNGNLIVTLTDDTELDLGKVTGDKGTQGEQGDKGDKGDKGDTGVGVKSVTVDDDGNLIITLTDNTKHNAGKVTGKDGSQGDKGDTGIGVKSVTIDENGNLIITLTDETVYNAGKVTGNDGNKGETGDKGVGVKSIKIDKSGNLIVTFTDDTVNNLGKVTGEKGESGINGAAGVGVKSTVVDKNGNLIITLTDGTVHNLGKITSNDGNSSKNSGNVAVGIKSAHIDTDGNLIITFTDGVISNLGKIVGTDGKDGSDGKDGIGIKGCRIDDDGNLILTLTDNTTLEAGNITAISDRVSVSKPLATAAVSLSGASLLWNIITLVIAIVRKKKTM